MCLKLAADFESDKTLIEEKIEIYRNVLSEDACVCELVSDKADLVC